MLNFSSQGERIYGKESLAPSEGHQPGMPETGFLVCPTDPKLAFTQFSHLTGVASPSTHTLKVDIEELLDFPPAPQYQPASSKSY